VLLPPGREAVEEPERVLNCFIKRHLVLVLAALLCESADTFMNPLVAVDLGSLGARWRRGGGDDVVDAGLHTDTQELVLITMHIYIYI
jgi:hypothetical protein